MLRFEQVVTADGEPPFDLELPSAGGAALIGPSGGTRTRLLAAAAGLLSPRSGRVLLDGGPVRVVDAGVLDEDRTLLPGLTAVENVATRVLARGPMKAADWTAIGALLRRLDLPESSLHNLAEQLSGGQQQRVALCRALSGSPAVLCLDDPVSELDDTTAELAWSVIADVARAGAVLLVGLPEPDPRCPAEQVVDVARPIASGPRAARVP